jgi:hypothetical protein
VQKAKASAEAYKKTYANYYNGLSPQDLERLNQILSRPLTNPNLPREAADGSKIRRNTKNPQKEDEPPRPIGGFFVYMREIRESQEVQKEAEQQGVQKKDMQIWLAKKGGQTWAVMSPDEKKVGLGLDIVAFDGIPLIVLTRSRYRSSC